MELMYNIANYVKWCDMLSLKASSYKNLIRFKKSCLDLLK